MLEGITRSRHMAVHGESLPTGAAHTSPGVTRLSAMLSDFSNVWNSCEVASKKAHLQNDKHGICWPHRNTSANCVSEHKSPLLGQEQLVAGQHCSKVEVWEHDHQRKYHIVPHDAWRRFVFHYVQDGRYVRKMAYLKRHITSRGRLYMILTIISEKL